MTRFVCTVMILALAVAAQADIYKWVDQRGTVNYTEDLGKVPKKYRKKVTVIPEGGAPAAEVTETVERGGKEKKPETGQKEVENALAPKQEKKKMVYGGKDEDAWKTEFRTLRSEIKANEAELAARRGRLANPGTMNRGDFLGVQREAKRIEETLTGLNTKLNTLEESAQRAGVPLELRK
ncbi:DUF4124 domain-containing protein [Geobacter grbiciae]|uniref:DUF4124 domain-containing protein n=1 Tax=Geobacter grbiciae TaxID=155042 RepID=UPI001C022F21|nr:DUF4124 domain-containing protein [Geobacter grbiciae]MBT1076844.1 DUF4124 domain-containing protein [Geobacter grbiciae]